MPYLKRKLDDAYEIHAGGAAANLFGANYRRDEPDENVGYCWISDLDPGSCPLTDELLLGLSKRKADIPTQTASAENLSHNKRSLLLFNPCLQSGVPI